MVRYISTRGQTPPLRFAEVLMEGLARDGGLYVPESWPRLIPAQLGGFSGLSYEAVAGAVTGPFVEDGKAMAEAIGSAYAGFRHKAVTPLVQLDHNLWLLELFHGPTFAFKDLALQILARLMDRELHAKGLHITLVGATSGDTGSAAIEAFKGRPSVDIFILHPKGRVSDIQRRQMTTVDAANVHNIALEGTFDDCQAVVKALFNDLKFRDRYRLAGVNSINWARILAQIPYYAVAASQLGADASDGALRARGRKIAFSVPTGNFGDIFAGYAALQMGVPIERLVIATNENDILVRCLETGRYERGAVKATQSPSMDIQVSSNFERVLFDAVNRDAGRLGALMKSLEETGSFTLDAATLAKLRGQFEALRIDEAETAATIKRVHAETGMIVDPHTAVGIAAGRKSRRDPAVPMVCLATAHPAKFPDAVKKAIGRAPPMPDALAALEGLPERLTILPNDPARVQDFIKGASRA